MKTATLVLATIGYAAMLWTGAAAAQRGRTPAPPALPPLSMTCPHHPDVIESRPGTCPMCKMKLVPVRLDAAWMCPIHGNVIEARSGTCRICQRQLIQVTVALTWTCQAQPGIDRIDPGTCPDGSPTIPRRTLRPHGNHNPQYGGQFFMAPDNWHHLEGTYPRSGVFRLYLYDDFARPLPADQMKRVRARVVTKETFDPATRKTTELSAVPLRTGRAGTYLEARVDTAALPAEMTAKVQFGSDTPEYRFDFTFPALTKAPAAPVARGPGLGARDSGAATRDAARGPRATEPSAPGAKPDARTATSVAPDPDPRAPSPESRAPSPESRVPGPESPSPEIPDTMTGIVERLQVYRREIGDLVMRGDFGAVWVPAFQAKDLAIALEPHLAHLTPAQRESGEPAVKAVVRAAWLLDAWGDVGNRQQIESAYAAFAAAVGEVATAFGEAPR